MIRNPDPRSNRFPTGGLALAALIATCLISVGVLPGGQSPPQGELRLGGPRITRDGSLEVALELARLPHGLTGIQFELVLANRDVQLDGRLSPELEQIGKSLYLQRLGPGVFRFLIAGLNQSEINQGVLAIVALTGANVSQSALDGLSIQRVVGTDGLGRRIEIGVARRPGREGGVPREKSGRSRHPDSD